MLGKRLLALTAAGALVLAACGGDDDADDGAPAATEAPDVTEAPDTEEPDTTEAPDTEPDTTEAPDDTEPAVVGDEPFAVNIDACEDPDAATAPIEGEVVIGQSMPLSGGPAVLFAPWAAGYQAYFDYYNETFGGIGGELPIRFVVKDDQYTADLTRGNVDELVFDDEVDLISGIIGSPNNSAVQADLNAQCIPQLWAGTGSSAWGQVNTYPWTTGVLVPYPIEVEAFLRYAAEQFPDGGTLGLFYVNNEFGQEYLAAAQERAGEFGFDIVAEETIDAADSGAPSGQMTNLVSANPDAIIAVPLGGQCIAFMTELGNVQAANPDFDPIVYQTATCAAPIFFNAVGNGGNDGVLTSANIKDVNDPELRENDPDVAAYLAAFEATGSDTDPGGIAAAGWLGAEATVHNLEVAYATGTLSRETIINAVRNIDYIPTLLRDGLALQMGPEDGFAAEGTQLQAWSVADGGFRDVGDVVNLEGFLGVTD